MCGNSQKAALEINIESPATERTDFLCVSIPAKNDIEEFLDYLYLMGISKSRFRPFRKILKNIEILLRWKGKKKAEKS